VSYDSDNAKSAAGGRILPIIVLTGRCTLNAERGNGGVKAAQAEAVKLMAR